MAKSAGSGTATAPVQASPESGNRPRMTMRREPRDRERETLASLPIAPGEDAILDAKEVGRRLNAQLRAVAFALARLDAEAKGIVEGAQSRDFGPVLPHEIVGGPAVGDGFVREEAVVTPEAALDPGDARGTNVRRELVEGALLSRPIETVGEIRVAATDEIDIAQEAATAVETSRALDRGGGGRPAQSFGVQRGRGGEEFHGGCGLDVEGGVAFEEHPRRVEIPDVDRDYGRSKDLAFKHRLDGLAEPVRPLRHRGSRCMVGEGPEEGEKKAGALCPVHRLSTSSRIRVSARLGERFHRLRPLARQKRLMNPYPHPAGNDPPAADDAIETDKAHRHHRSFGFDGQLEAAALEGAHGRIAAPSPFRKEGDGHAVSDSSGGRRETSLRPEGPGPVDGDVA